MSRETKDAVESAQSQTLLFLQAQLRDLREKIETHISYVLVGENIVFKLKKAVAFSYLDFSTPKQRLAMCLREFSLNQKYASNLYLGVRRITRAANDALEFDGAGALVDAVVVMQRFDDGALFDALARQGALTQTMIEELIRRIAANHEAEASQFSSCDPLPLREEMMQSIESLHAAQVGVAWERDAYAVKLSAYFSSMADVLTARCHGGSVRRCHADLTLHNICLFHGAPTPFDCLEFSDALATIDVLYDVAFLIMDLRHSGADLLANVAFNRYLDVRDETDGVSLMPFFLSLRAMIRAYVEKSQRHPEKALSYFALARQTLVPSIGFIIAIGGLSGAGKSSVAQALAPMIGAAPGARIFNSDRIRKRMFGVSPHDNLPVEAYAPFVSEQVYRDLFTQARCLAQRNWPVIVEAVFDRPEDRAAIEFVAQEVGVGFLGVWLDVDLDRRLARVAARRDDVSDATGDVLLAQMRKQTGDISWRRIEATSAIDATVCEISALVEAAPLCVQGFT